VHKGEARDIRARSREAYSEASLHRVHQHWADNRNVAGWVIGGGNAFYDDDVDWEIHQFCRQLRAEGKISSC
jgi:hypothetical protein